MARRERPVSDGKHRCRAICDGRERRWEDPPSEPRDYRDGAAPGIRRRGRAVRTEPTTTTTTRRKRRRGGGRADDDRRWRWRRRTAADGGDGACRRRRADCVSARRPRGRWDDGEGRRRWRKEDSMGVIAAPSNGRGASSRGEEGGTASRGWPRWAEWRIGRE